MSLDEGQLRFEVQGDLQMPLAPDGGWNLSSVWHVGNRWVAFDEALVGVYNSNFNLIHSRDYGGPGSEIVVVARQEETWGLAITHFGTGLECLNEMSFQDASMSFFSFEGVCE
jgi:hypothetical protein